MWSGVGPETAFLTNSQMLLMLLVPALISWANKIESKPLSFLSPDILFQKPWENKATKYSFFFSVIFVMQIMFPTLLGFILSVFWERWSLCTWPQLPPSPGAADSWECVMLLFRDVLEKKVTLMVKVNQSSAGWKEKQKNGNSPELDLLMVLDF